MWRMDDVSMVVQSLDLTANVQRRVIRPWFLEQCALLDTRTTVVVLRTDTVVVLAQLR